ncbi:hypothetical protein AcW1_009082 [Taiwanofungus camphoratus]|nr:hypothetical protein AcV5_007103 [Antrodia cinnamomea]KAI0930369.1 hypothetical protein AcV5_007103 [Antrodia cinnamomea]KAI0949478.1 hypothetical protein AcW1_009082 [Antrodia cinnamomea]KAI0949479.1 hypothetical protein AcW1_009082 [Antrodia cinnamomea]KAI0958712.1 hypothetical protein AcV7_004447 [Antrodia cinnamomea]
MSVARAASVLLRPRQASTSLIQRRFASSHSNDEHHDEHHGEQDTTAYPREDFSSPVWRNFVLLGLAVAGWYKFAPAPGEDTYLTRFIAHYSTPREVWQRLSLKHLMLSVEGSDESLLMQSAQRPPVHRYRYPQRFEQSSPHSHPVGAVSVISDVVVKGDRA